MTKRPKCEGDNDDDVEEAIATAYKHSLFSSILEENAAQLNPTVLSQVFSRLAREHPKSLWDKNLFTTSDPVGKDSFVVNIESPSILVVGSLNMDYVTRTVEGIPQPGQTLLGLSKREYFGGKGANAAVCMARLQGNVCMVGCLGQDSDGDKIYSNLKNERMNTQFIQRRADVETGSASVTVCGKTGENTVLVVPGANFSLLPSDVPLTMDRFTVVFCQNEIPLETTLHAFRVAKTSSLKPTTFWNPAPAPLAVTKEVLTVLELVDILCVNESEASLFALAIAPRALVDLVPTVIVTLGSKGCALYQRGKTHDQPHMFPMSESDQKVHVVDTTGAGDCFCASVALALSRGLPIEQCIPVANSIAAMSVQKHGAQNSYPYLSELSPAIVRLLTDRQEQV